MQKTVLSFGETLWDILLDVTTLGGAPFNFAYRVNCLGEKGLMVSRLGRDELGRQAIEKVRELAVDTAYIQWDDEHPTGTVKVSFDAEHHPDYVIIPEVAYDYVETTDVLLAIAAEADCLCFGTLTQRSPTTRETLYQMIGAAGKAVKLLDINLRKKCYTPATVKESLRRADVLKLNDDEALQLAEMLNLAERAIDRIGEQLIERYQLSCCIVTLAERGALVTSKAGEKVYSPGYRVELVDSLGCGDAFSAGFIQRYLRGASSGECCRWGNTLGALVATQQGATEKVTDNDLSQFLSSHPARTIDPTLEPFAIE